MKTIFLPSNTIIFEVGGDNFDCTIGGRLLLNDGTNGTRKMERKVPQTPISKRWNFRNGMDYVKWI